jgi:hypothetical protein
MTPATNARMSIDTGKSRRGRPRVDSEDVSARMERGMLDALDAWIAAQPEPRPRRSEAIRRLVAEALRGPAAVKSPIGDLPPPLPPPSEAFQRDLALSKARKARAGAPGARLRKVAK